MGWRLDYHTSRDTIKNVIVKPWSKSESKPLSQQSLNLNKITEKGKMMDLDQGLTQYLHEPTTQPTQPKKIYQVDSEIKDMG